LSGLVDLDLFAEAKATGKKVVWQAINRGLIQDHRVP
jgi:hypothetical protein